MNNHYYYENDEQKKSTSLVPFLATAGLGFLSWKLYSNPIFRRDFIQGCFNTYDYLYDKYYNLRYDNKVRRTSLLKKQTIENKQKLIDFLYSDDSSVCPESEVESDTSNNSSIISMIDSSHKYTLIEFLSNELKFESLTYKEKKYYILGTKANNQENKDNKDITDKIIEFPWLAASLEINYNDGTSSSYEITDKFKNFWIEHNQLPLHIEYYDIWISELISDKQSYPTKENIKEIKLSVIDPQGDFIEYSDVLIEPHRNETKIINIPSLNLKDKNDEEEEEVEEEEVEEEEVEEEEVEEVEEKEVEEKEVEEKEVEEVEEVEEKEVEEKEVEEEEVEEVEEKEVEEKEVEEVEEKEVEEKDEDDDTVVEEEVDVEINILA